MTPNRRHTIRLRHTDAAGLLFFPRLFEIVQDTLEDLMDATGSTLAERLAGDGPILPIAHCEADFVRPLRVGDVVTVEVALEREGERSFTLGFVFRDEGGAEAARAQTVHVAMDRRTGASVPLTDAMRMTIAVLRS